MANNPISSPKISRSEWVMVLGVTLVMLVITAVPYLFAYTTAQPGLVFMDTLMNPEDSQTYFAKMLQGYDGKWLYTITFTPEPHDAAFVGVFYVWLGQLARALTASVTAVWHGSRVAAQVILCFVTFWFVAQFSLSRGHRWTAYLLALSASGLGWLLFLLGQLYWLDAFPVDFKEPGAHLFFTLLTYPHIILATALILLSVVFLARLAERPSWPLSVFTGFIHLALGIAYPFLLYLVALIAGLHYLALLWRERRILWLLGWQYAAAFLIPLPLYLYFAYTLRQNEAFHAWDVQAVTPSAPWPHYLVAFAPFLLFGGLYAWKRWQEQSSMLILWLWVLAAGLLLYAPLNPQRRFIQGVHAPLSILAAAGFVTVALPWLLHTRPLRRLLSNPRYTEIKMTRFVTAVFLLVMALSNLYIWASVSASAVIQQPDPLFRPADEVAAVVWLRAENERTSGETAVVLGEYQTGNLVAARAGNQVVVGHWAETIDYDNKLAEATQFYDEQTGDDWRQALLKKYGIKYVWHGPREQVLGTFQPETAVYLRPVYQNETITIYAVIE